MLFSKINHELHMNDCRKQFMIKYKNVILILFWVQFAFFIPNLISSLVDLLRFQANLY